MNDPLSELYTESVAQPQKFTKKIDTGKKGTVGNLKVDEDFGFEKKGIQKGTGPDSKTGFKKVKESKEEEDMKQEPAVGSQFDALFSRTIKEDFEPGMSTEAEDDLEFGGGEGGDELGGDDEFGAPEDDLGAEGPATADELLQNIANMIQEFLGAQGGEEEFGDEEPEDIEDLDNDEMGDEGHDELDMSSNNEPHRPIGEDAQMPSQQTRDGKIGKAKEFSKGLQSPRGSNKVGGHFGKKSGGKASDHGSDSKPRDGKLRPGPDYKSLQSKGNITVKQSGSPGKQGSALF